MSCKIYVEEKGDHIHVATLKDRKAAEDYWKLSRENYRDKYGYLPEPIYVETGKGKRKHVK